MKPTRTAPLFCAPSDSAAHGCRGEAVSTGTIGVIREAEFGNTYIDKTIDAFHALGFAFGDSVNLSFDNGTVLEDVPYYSGYYTQIGGLLLCGYPGYPHVLLARNYGDSTWAEYGVTADTTVTVTLHEKGKYRKTQELFSLLYSDARSDFCSDAVFANFREMRGGKLKAKTLFRSASPCDNQHGRAAFADRLTKEAGVRFVLDLSDTREKYFSYTEKADFDSPYYDALFRAGLVLPLALNANYRTDVFAKTISAAFAAMAAQDGPCLIHCMEGKDRTGFVCALALALAGATAQEIIDDYMITYENYYGLTKESNPERYEAVKGFANEFLYCLCGAERGTPTDTLNLQSGAEAYLRRGGLNDLQIAAVEAYLTV